MTWHLESYESYIQCLTIITWMIRKQQTQDNSLRSVRSGSMYMSQDACNFYSICRVSDDRWVGNQLVVMYSVRSMDVNCENETIQTWKQCYWSDLFTWIVKMCVIHYFLIIENYKNEILHLSYGPMTLGMKRLYGTWNYSPGELGVLLWLKPWKFVKSGFVLSLTQYLVDF